MSMNSCAAEASLPEPGPAGRYRPPTAVTIALPVPYRNDSLAPPGRPWPRAVTAAGPAAPGVSTPAFR
jgi:hypothetical protein